LLAVLKQAFEFAVESLLLDSLLWFYINLLNVLTGMQALMNEMGRA
jgi:hypothetical protein